MTTVIVRRIGACPARTASEAWRFICSLISAEATQARTELAAVEGVASALIADECPKDSPIVLRGDGPRLRIYCLYGEDSTDSDACDETALPWPPTAGDWELWLPCPPEDLPWVRRNLAAKSGRVRAYEVGGELEEDRAPEKSKTEGAKFNFGKDAFAP